MPYLYALVDTEDAVIAALMLGVPWGVPELRTLEPQHFKSDSNRWVFMAIQDLRAQGRDTHWLTVKLHMSREYPREYEAIGKDYFKVHADWFRWHPLTNSFLREWVLDIQRAALERSSRTRIRKPQRGKGLDVRFRCSNSNE